MFDAIPAQVIADRVFADERDDDDIDDDAQPEGNRYVARLALSDAESEAKFVEALNERRQRFADSQDDDPAMVASLQRLARTAWIHQCRTRAAAEGAEWDPVCRPLALRVIVRAQRAAGAIARAAARAVTRAAIRARNLARDRIGVPARLSQMRRLVNRSPRPRTPHARRVRVTAGTSAGSGSDEPSPEPPGQHDGACLPAGRRP
jgi:hypothetical protein